MTATVAGQTLLAGYPLLEYRHRAKLACCPDLLPELAFTGHEVCHGSTVEIPEQHRGYSELVGARPEILPEAFHIDLDGNVPPKVEPWRAFGFCPPARQLPVDRGESCGAHRPLLATPELATRASRARIPHGVLPAGSPGHPLWIRPARSSPARRGSPTGNSSV